MPAQKYRKLPVVIEAIQFLDTTENDVLCFLGQYSFIDPDDGALFIHTLEGVMKACLGDYIIKGVNGEFYPCKPEIFEKTYKLADDDEEGGE